jgi:hypothetical protein
VLDVCRARNPPIAVDEPQGDTCLCPRDTRCWAGATPLEILSDPKATKAIRKAEADIDTGKGESSADDLRARYLKH